MNNPTMNDTRTTKVSSGDYILVTRWYASDDDLPEPIVATVAPMVTGPDSVGDLFVTHNDNGGRWARDWKRIPKPGERIVTVTVPGVEDRNGNVGTVADLTESEVWGSLALQHGNIRDGKPRLYVRYDDDRLYYCSEWTEVPVDETPVEDMAERTLADRIGPIVRLTPELAAFVNRMETLEDAAVEYVRAQTAHDSLQSQVTRLRQEVAGLRGDMTLAANTVRDQAVERDWCTEFESVNERLVGRMSSYGAGLWQDESAREKEYEVEVQVPVSGTARKTFTVTASSEDDAAEKAMEMAQEDMDSDDIDNYDVNWDWYNAESEVR